MKLENFRRYENETIDFPDGLIGIVGKNGTGKSTLIEALGWCLYGNDAAKTKKDEIKRSNASEKSECKVTLELLLDSDSLKVERSLRGKTLSSHAQLFLNGEESASVNGALDVTKYIAKRTGMDHVTFFTSVFAKQKELAALSNLGKAERRKTVLRLLGVEQINDVVALIRVDLRENKKILEFLQENARDIDEIIEGLKQLEESKKSKTDEITKIKSLVSNLDKSLKTVKEKFLTLEQKYKKHQQIEKQISEINGKINSKQDEKTNVELDLNDALKAQKEYVKLQPKLEEFTKIKSEKDEYDSIAIKHAEKISLEQQYDECESQIREKNDEISRLNSSIKDEKDLDGLLEGVSHNLDALQIEFEQNRNQENKIQTIIDERKNQKNILKDEFDEIKKLGDKSICSRCQQPISKEYIPVISEHYATLINKLYEEIKLHITEKSKFTNKMSEISEKIQLKQKEEKVLKQKIQELERLQIKIKEFNNTLYVLTSKKIRIEKQLEKFVSIKYDEKKHLQIRTKFDELQVINDTAISLKTKSNSITSLNNRLDSINDKISSMNEKISFYQEQIKQVGFDEKEYDKVKISKDESEEKYHQQKIILVEIKYDLSNIDDKITRQQKDIKDEKSRQEIKKDAEKKVESLKYLESIMNEFKMDLVSRIKPQLSSRTSDLFRQMTAGKYSSIDLDDDYTIWINDQGKPHPIERYSGGESDLANLCMRIAISQELSHRAGGSKTQFIVLDEIFGSQDENRQESILQALKYLETQFRQILLITHIENIKESLPNVFLVKENVDNTVTIEEEGRMFV